MNNSYPKISTQTRSGNRGLENVARTVTEFGWLFRRTHQEDDFGIDGYIDVVMEDGSVTGQVVAVQIKHGATYFTRKTDAGYIFRGEIKHFNYYCNNPAPVLLILSHPKNDQCYWQLFDPAETEHNQGSWTIEVPFSNKLSTSKNAITALCTPTHDHIGKYREAAEHAELIRSSGFIALHIPRKDVVARKVDLARNLFDSLKRTKKLAREAQGKVVIYFSGYEDDPRELYEIPEVRFFVPLLDFALPELFYFARTEEPGLTITILAACQSPIKVRTKNGEKITLELDLEYLSAFLDRHWPGLNEMTDWLGMSDEENERIGRAAAAAVWPEIWRGRSTKGGPAK